MNGQSPGLFGLKNSNRNFMDASSWGKNQFNSSFPASLAAYMEKQGLECVYLKTDKKLNVVHSKISTTELYGINPIGEDVYYAFESQFIPFQPIVTGSIPRTDLVILDKSSNKSIRGLEIKLTAVPDNTTCHLAEDQYGSELVVRPDTIVYLACSILNNFTGNTQKLVELIGDGFHAIEDWKDGNNIYNSICLMAAAIDRISVYLWDRQRPLVMQPVWKTLGKSPELAENCLDVFVWSDLAFVQLFINVARKELSSKRTITRQVRTAVWLFRMIYDYSISSHIDHRLIIDALSYDTKNDKAFAVSGMVTHPYMSGDVLTKPRIQKNQIKEIILGGGQNLLSPERRFDAIIFNSPDLFE